MLVTKQKKSMFFEWNGTIPKNERQTIEFGLVIIGDFYIIIVQLTCIYVHIYILHYFSHLYPTVHLQAKKIEGYCHHLKFWVKEVPKKVDFRSLS